MRIETHSTLKPTSLKILTSRKWGFCSLPRRNGSEDEIAACVSMTCGFMCWQTIKSQIPLKSIITQVNYQSSQLPLKSIISQVNYHSSQISLKYLHAYYPSSQLYRDGSHGYPYEPSRRIWQRPSQKGYEHLWPGLLISRTRTFSHG